MVGGLGGSLRVGLGLCQFDMLSSKYLITSSFHEIHLFIFSVI